MGALFVTRPLRGDYTQTPARVNFSARNRLRMSGRSWSFTGMHGVQSIFISGPTRSLHIQTPSLTNLSKCIGISGYLSGAKPDPRRLLTTGYES